MSGWGDWTNFAKTALSSAQKQLDKALDVQPGSEEESGSSITRQLQDDFFAAFGINALAPGAELEATYCEEPSSKPPSTSQPSSSSGWSKNVADLTKTASKFNVKSIASWLGPSTSHDLQNLVTEGTSAIDPGDAVVPTRDDSELEISTNDVKSINPTLGISAHGDWSSPDLFVDESMPLEGSSRDLHDPRLPQDFDLDNAETKPDLGVTLPLSCAVQHPKESAVANWLDELVSPATSHGYEGAQLTLDLEEDQDGLRECQLDEVFSASRSITERSLTEPASPSLEERQDSNTVHSSIAETSSCSGCTLVEQASSQEAAASPRLISGRSTMDNSWTDLAQQLSVRSGRAEPRKPSVQECFQQDDGQTTEETETTHGQVEQQRMVVVDVIRAVINVVERQLDDSPLDPDQRRLSPSHESLNSPPLSDPGQMLLGSPPDSPFDESGPQPSPHSSRRKLSANGILSRKRPHAAPPPVTCHAKQTPTSSRSHSTEEVSSSSAATNEQMLASILSSDIEILSNPTPNNEECSSEHSFNLNKGWVVPRQTSRERGPCQSSASKRHRRTGSDLPASGDETVGAQLQELTEKYQIVESRFLKLQCDHRQALDQVTTSHRMQQNLKAENSVLFERCSKLESEVKKLGTSSEQIQLLELRIQDLTREGEELAKREGKHTSIIKKSKDRENQLQKTIDTLTSKVRELENFRDKARDLGRKDRENEDLKYQAQVTIEKQSEKINDLTCTIEDLEEQCATHKSTVEKAYREIAELSKSKSLLDVEVESLRKERDTVSLDGEKAELSDAVARLEEERGGLLAQLEDLRITLIQQAEDAARREDSLKWEVKQLQRKLEDADSRNEELGRSAVDATKPLLRQLESLQASHQAQASNWERLERALYDQLSEAETTLAEKREAEAAGSLQSTHMKQELARLQSQLSLAQSELTKLKAELEGARKREVEGREKVQSLQSELTSTRRVHDSVLSDLRKEKELIEAQVEYEREQGRTAMQVATKDLAEVLEEKDREIRSLNAQVLDSLQTMAMPGLDQPGHSAFNPRDRGDASPMSSRSGQLFTFDDTESQDSRLFDPLLAAGGSAVFVDHLQSMLARKHSELASLKDDCRRLNVARESLVSQVASMAAEADAAKENIEELEARLAQVEETENRYQTLLQMYGEKTEENDELKLDIADMKEAYKTQIDDLLKRLGEL